MPRISKEKPISAEIRIKEAAHKVFLAKGFSATTVRDVAKVAGTNVALVNYYFRSKKNLFNVVMLEKLQLLFGAISPILNNQSTTLDEKITGLVNSYIDFLIKNPDLLTFIMSEIRKGNFEAITQLKIESVVHKSYFMKQLKDESGHISYVHFLLSLLGMIAIPFVAMPTILKTRLLSEAAFMKMMQERKTLVPVWIKAILKTSSRKVI